MNEELARLQERIAALQLQIDQRFAGQETAVQAALDAAEKAVAKAEIAAEKRFESVNEFRAQLTDQAATFLSRQEAEIRISSISEKTDIETKRNSAAISELELRLTSRLDRMEGQVSGSQLRGTDTRLNIGTVLQLLAVLIAFAAVLVVVFHH